MQAVAVFGGGEGGGGGGGSMSTVSREENLVMSSEDSSSPDEGGGELELGLGLSLGGRDGGFKGQQGLKVGRYARILTAKDLPSVVSAASSSSSPSTSSSSSSSVLSRANNNATTLGTKRSADSFAAPNGASSQVVGWPPIRAYRMNSMVNQAKSLATEEFNSMSEKNISKNKVREKADYAINVNNGNAKTRTSFFVKVNMDGVPIGRKVDLKAHGGYEALSRALEDMFLRAPATVNGISVLEHNMTIDAARRPRLLDGSSEFVLTYEDKEGDWMLVGDVPWGMFLSFVRRLRIMRTSEATGLGK